jgi:hypothetical protein
MRGHLESRLDQIPTKRDLKKVASGSGSAVRGRLPLRSQLREAVIIFMLDWRFSG